MSIYLILLCLVLAIPTGLFIAYYTSMIINKSPDCENKIEFSFKSGRSLLIILINEILILLVIWRMGVSIVGLCYMVVSSCLLALSIVDFAIFEIPIEFNVIILVMSIPVVIYDIEHWYLHLIGALCISVPFWIMTKIKVRGQEIMGGGDAKLMFTCGLLLGCAGILFALIIGCIIGTIIHYSRMLIEKKEHMLSFGPYLSMGIMVMMLFGNGIKMWYLSTFIL